MDPGILRTIDDQQTVDVWPMYENETCVFIFIFINEKKIGMILDHLSGCVRRVKDIAGANNE